MKERYSILVILLCTLFLIFSSIHLARGGGIQLQSGDAAQTNLLEAHQQALNNDGTVCYRSVQNDVFASDATAETTVTKHVADFNNRRAATYTEQDYDIHVAPHNGTTSIEERSLDTGERTPHSTFSEASPVESILFTQTGVNKATLSRDGLALYNGRLVTVYRGIRAIGSTTNESTSHVHYTLYIDGSGRINYLEVNEDRQDEFGIEQLTIYTPCGQDTVPDPETTRTP